MNSDLDFSLNRTDQLLAQLMQEYNISLASKIKVIAGMNHAQSGDYGEQPGDRSATIPNDQAKSQLATTAHSFFANQE